MNKTPRNSNVPLLGTLNVTRLAFYKRRLIASLVKAYENKKMCQSIKPHKTDRFGDAITIKPLILEKPTRLGHEMNRCGSGRSDQLSQEDDNKTEKSMREISIMVSPTKVSHFSKNKKGTAFLRSN